MTENRTSGFFTSRWQGTADLAVLFWRDMLFVGTLINLVAGFAAFIMFTWNVPPAWALSVHLAPVPYNIFLLMSVWRAKQSTSFTSSIAAIWFVLMLVI